MRFLLLAAVASLAAPSLGQTSTLVLPPLGPPPAFAAPQVDQFALSNGLSVYLVEQDDVPIIQVDVVLRAGSVDDPAGLDGITVLTSELLDDGAAGRSKDEIADALGRLGILFSVASDRDATRLRMTTAVPRLEEALGLLADIALRPDFPEAAVADHREANQAYFDRARQSAVSTANEQFWRAVYGDDHPYGRSYYGSVQGLAAIGRDDVVAHHALIFNPFNVALVIAGAVEAEELRPLLEHAFGNGWPTGTPPPRVEVARTSVKPRAVYLVDRPGLTQSVIRVSAEAPPRSSPDHYAMSVLNMILGGATSSRLGSRISQEQGLAYEARSNLHALRAGGTIVAFANVEKTTTASALSIFAAEIDRVGEISQEELRRAQDILVLSYPEPLGVVWGLTPVLGETFVYDLPREAFAQYEDRIRSVTLGDLQRVVDRYLSPHRWSYVVVGDLDEIEAEIRALGIGEVEILTEDDIFGTAQ